MSDNQKESPSNTKLAFMETGAFLFDAINASKQYKFEKKMQRHRDRVRQIGNSINDFAITRNAIWAEEDLRLNRLMSDLESANAAGTSVVQTAVMGFSGNTADAIANSYQQSADLQRKAIDRQQNRIQRTENYERLSNNWNTYTQMERVHSPVAKPNYGAMATKSAMNFIKQTG